MATNSEIPPLVSVCVITYNHEKFLRDCLEGIVMQKTTFPIEALVHDDASTDGTADIIREYAQNYPNIFKPVYQTENQHTKGVPISATFVWPKARGAYLALCEGDDYWIDPQKLQKQVNFLESHPDYYLVLGQTLRRIGDEIRSWEPRWDTRRTDFDVRDYICKSLGHTSAMCCRNRFEACRDQYANPEDRDYTVLQGDQQFVLLQSLPGSDKIKYLDEPLSVYRDHAGGVTKTDYNLNLDNAMNSYLGILKDFDKYSQGYYGEVIKYRIREVETLRHIRKEHSYLRKLFICLRNVRVLFKYLLRRYAGRRPF